MKVLNTIFCLLYLLIGGFLSVVMVVVMILIDSFSDRDENFFISLGVLLFTVYGIYLSISQLLKISGLKKGKNIITQWDNNSEHILDDIFKD